MHDKLFGDTPRVTFVKWAFRGADCSHGQLTANRFASFATSTLIYGIICGVGGNNMATSSITANFVMRDPKVSRAFVKALLARRPSGNVPRIRNDWEVLSDPENIREFFGHRAAKEALHA